MSYTLYIEIRKASLLRIKEKEKEQATADVLSVEETGIALKIAEAPQLRVKARARVSPKERGKERLRVRIKEAKGLRVGASLVVDPTMRPIARRVRAKRGKQMNCKIRTNGEHRASRTHITPCPNHLDQMVHRGSTQHLPSATRACQGKGNPGSRAP